MATANLRSLPTSADPQKVSASVTVASSCSFTGVEDPDHPHTVDMINGQHFTGDETGYTTLSTFCNDANGYEIYAQGCTIEDEDGNCATTGENTKMIDESNSNSDTNYIATGLFPDAPLASAPSSWAMTLIPGATGQIPEVSSDYKDKYGLVPTNSIVVASYPASTTGEYKTSSTLTTNYEVYISPTQPAGTYTGKVKYTMLSAPAILASQYIQDVTLNSCAVNVGTNGNPANIGDNITVSDLRDGNLYTIRYINGKCWMTQNLRFTNSTLYPSTSNVAKTTTMTYYDLADSANCALEGASADTPLGYSNICIHSSEDDIIGAHYNLAAASASSVTEFRNIAPAYQDICPAGWHLPSAPNTIAGTDTNKLFSNTTSGWQSPTTGLVAFDATTGGSYVNGRLGNTIDGLWWGSSAYGDNYTRYILLYRNTTGQFMGNYYLSRAIGLSVRCVLDDRTLNDITYMQEVTPAIVKNTAEGAEKTLTDLRTYSNGLSNTYTVKKINGQLWMTQNLRITGTISAKYSNFSGADFNASAYDLTDADNCGGTGASAAAPKGYANACTHTGQDSAGNDTAWYNYAAATAGTISGYSNSESATQDICPAGWHLYAYSEANTLFNSQNSGWQTSDYLAALNGTTGGIYSNGALQNTGRSSYLSSAMASERLILPLLYRGNNSYFKGATGGRADGAYVRCVANS